MPAHDNGLFHAVTTDLGFPRSRSECAYPRCPPKAARNRSWATDRWGALEWRFRTVSLHREPGALKLLSPAPS